MFVWGHRGHSGSEDTVMSEGAPFDRMLAALHDAALDDAQWPAASAVFDDVCRTKGNFLAYARGPSQRDVEIDFIWLYYRGERHHDLEREYTHVYYPGTNGFRA